MDVYHPYGTISDDGKKWHLNRLQDVISSVEMVEKCHYDPLNGRWIDEWIPAFGPQKALY